MCHQATQALLLTTSLSWATLSPGNSSPFAHGFLSLSFLLLPDDSGPFAFFFFFFFLSFLFFFSFFFYFFNLFFFLSSLHLSSSFFFFFFFSSHLLLLNQRLVKTCSCFIRCHIITQISSFPCNSELATTSFLFQKINRYTVHSARTLATLQNASISSGHAYLLFIFCTYRRPPYECMVPLCTRHAPHLGFRDTFSFHPFESSKMWLLLCSASLLASKSLSSTLILLLLAHFSILVKLFPLPPLLSCCMCIHFLVSVGALFFPVLSGDDPWPLFLTGLILQRPPPAIAHAFCVFFLSVV